MENKHLVVVHTTTKEILNESKLCDCETYDSIISRALNALKEKNTEKV
jgi:hypothetical protein